MDCAYGPAMACAATVGEQSEKEDEVGAVRPGDGLPAAIRELREIKVHD
jgi:hypothetical protein